MVAGAGRLDLHDVGALVAQDVGGPRAGQHRGQVDDPDSRERTRHGCLLVDRQSRRSVELRYSLDNYLALRIPPADPRADLCIIVARVTAPMLILIACCRS